MKNNKWILISLIGIIFVCALVFLLLNLQMKSATPTIGDVLTKGQSSERAFFDPWQLNFALMGLLMVSFVALTVQGIRKPKCDCATKENIYDKVTAESEPNPVEDEFRQLKLEHEEIHRTHTKVLSEKTSLEKEIKKYEDIISNMLGNEEVLKKSNEALRKKYDRLVAEKENLILEINRKNWELQETRIKIETTDAVAAVDNSAKTAPEARPDTLIDQQERKAVEELIKEVDEIIKQQETKVSVEQKNSIPVKTRKLKRKNVSFSAVETTENSSRKRVKK